MKKLEPFRLKKSSVLMFDDSWLTKFRRSVPDPGTNEYRDFKKFLKKREKVVSRNNKIALEAIFEVLNKHKSTSWKKKAISKIIEDIYIQKGIHENHGMFSY